MKELLKSLDELKETGIRGSVEQRLKELKLNREFFSELCFCILTANPSAESRIKCQQGIGNGFKTLSEKELAARLKSLGYRFYNRRAGFIVLARKHENMLEFKDAFPAREWLVKNIKGIGMKEASHFLRNTGFTDVAILDRLCF